MAHHAITVSISTGIENEGFVISPEMRQEFWPDVGDHDVVEAFQSMLRARLVALRADKKRAEALHEAESYITANLQETR